MTLKTLEEDQNFANRNGIIWFSSSGFRFPAYKFFLTSRLYFNSKYDFFSLKKSSLTFGHYNKTDEGLRAKSWLFVQR